MGRQKHREAGDKLVSAAKGYIEAHSLEKFSLKKLSEALYINGSYLLRQFKAGTGQTLLEYHNAVRCENAKALLRDTDMNISEIGAAVGFVSSAHFSHVFKKVTDLTPTLYRENSRA
ncbi:MAG: helix-turn-helix transcriptional regulator [Clostridia bacterium]|nr:helix-turn-helix transcriptional regulator [Clostridia bacterium]